MASLKIKFKGDFFLLCALCLLIGKFGILIAYTISVLIHELAHYFVAKIYYYECNSISVSAFGAVLYGDFEDNVGKHQVWIALAGPVANLVLICICLSLWYVFPSCYAYTLDFVWANVSIAVINLLPCYPLDGGKVLCGLLKTSPKVSLTIVKQISVIVSIVAFLIFLVGFCFGFNLFLLGIFAVFLLLASFSSVQGSIYSRMALVHCATRLRQKGVEIKKYLFSSTSTLSHVIRRLDKSCLCEITVADYCGELLFFDHEQFRALTINYPLEATLADVIREEGRSIASTGKSKADYR